MQRNPSGVVRTLPMADHPCVRFSINIPNFGDFADARTVAAAALAAEQAGWDALFIWDHVEDEYGSFGEPTDPVILAERLDEGLDLLRRYWSGEQVDHVGRHYVVDGVTLLPATLQRPHPPVWVGGFWPHRKPMRRAAYWDGVVPLFATAGHGYFPPVDQVRDLIDYVRAQRGDRSGHFEVVLGGVTPGDPAAAAELLEPLRAAGATWWDERLPRRDENLCRLEPVLRRINAGPPRFA